MASLLRFAVNFIELQNVIKAKHHAAEASKRSHFLAARKIQAWWRGIATRNHIRKLHKSATILQRHWRGYRARMFVKQYLINRVHQMWQDHYHNMAIKIQAIWRGYWTRKTQINVLQLRQWRKGVCAKNIEIVNNMRSFRQQLLDKADDASEQKAMHWILFILFKLHHLVGTKCQPGVLTKIDKTRFTYIEEMLKCFQYEKYISRVQSIYKGCQIDYKRSLIFHGTYFEKCEKEIREFEKSLRKKNVSVFRNQSFETDRKGITEIERQKYKQFAYGGRCLQRKFMHMHPSELYEVISKMNCQLDRFRLNCPIHNIIA